VALFNARLVGCPLSSGILKTSALPIYGRLGVFLVLFSSKIFETQPHKHAFSP
jgi:hypothetical protein